MILKQWYSEKTHHKARESNKKGLAITTPQSLSEKILKHNKQASYKGFRNIFVAILYHNPEQS